MIIWLDQEKIIIIHNNIYSLKITIQNFTNPTNNEQLNLKNNIIINRIFLINNHINKIAEIQDNFIQ
jgi:hypothetical protein